jgi:hypothetical protein
MVRKLNHRFKNFLTMNIVFGSVVMAGINATYGVNMLISAYF